MVASVRSPHLASAFFDAGPRRFGSAQPLAGASDRAGIRVSVFDTLEDCAELWKAAFADCAGYAFQACAWHRVWLETIGRAERVSPCIVHIADRSGRTLMLLPLGVFRRRGVRLLKFLGEPVTDYNGPLIDADFAARLEPRDVRRLWSLILRRLPAVDVVWLKRMPETIEGAVNPLIGLPGAVHNENAHAARLPASLAEFKASHSSKLFKDNARLLKRLGELGPVAFTLGAEGEEAREVTEVMARQKGRRWLESSGVDLFAKPGYRAFYEQLASGPDKMTGVHVSALRVGDTVVASHWGVVHGGRFLYLMPGYEAGAWARYSCGRLLLQQLVEWCLSHRVGVFDLTVGDEPYKARWADHVLRLYEYLAPRSLRGALFVAWWRGRERLREYPQLRRIARGLRGGRCASP